MAQVNTDAAVPAVSRAWQDRRLWPIALGFAAIALCLTGVTLSTVWMARSEVPWHDQWVFLEDVKEIRAHVWSRLWYSYWGHRHVITRLFTLVDVRLFSGSNTPMILLILAEQAASAALLICIAWRLFARFSRPVFLIAAALFVQLCFSSLQLENFLWAVQIGYVLVWTSAIAAFFLLAVHAEASRPANALLIGCALLGIVSTLSSPNGVLVWPVLVLQAWVLRLRIRALKFLILIGAVAAGLYLWGYQPGPQLGMGVLRPLLHPEQSIPLLGMLLAGPLSAVSVPSAMAMGCLALVFALYALVKMVRSRPPALVTVYGALAVLALLTISSLVENRTSPEFVASRVNQHLLVLPSRYYTMIFFFWSGVMGISTWLTMKNRREWPQLAVLTAIAATLTLGTAWWQIGEAANWRGYYRELDVAGSAVIMEVDDPANRALAEVYAESGLRLRVSAWLEKEHLALFAERRGRLLGRRVASAEVEDGRCRGEAQSVTRVTDGLFRIAGWAVDTHTGQPPRDLVFADQSGLIIGIARSGLRRPDLKGNIDAVPFDTVGWEGYARGSKQVGVYGALGGSGHYCPVNFATPAGTRSGSR